MSYTDLQTSSAPSDVLPVGNRVEMFAAKPQPDLDSSINRAYAAQFKGGDGSSDLFAVVCDRNLPARLDIITPMRSIDHPGILRLIDSGVVAWPHDNTFRYAFAYQRPVAARMVQSVDEQHEMMSEDFLIHYFIQPMIGSLVELARAGIVHNAIRSNNIFWRLGSTAVPQLGECMSTPAGYAQPVLFETPERAMCTPMGRGVGQHVDDCYAFGVTLALLILGGNPLQGMDDATIIRTKIERGSFGALIGNRRISPGNIEILRGLLADDARQRWTAADLEQWTSGRRLTPKNTDAGRRAARAFEFMKHEYWQSRPLAMAMAEHVSEAAQIVENGSLDKWLHRALNDESRAASLTDAQAGLKLSGKTANYEDQLVARACIALDPAAPIRYRGLSVMPTGIATMLVETLASGGNVQMLAEIISSQLVSLWVEMQKDGKAELVPLGQQMERMKGLLEKATFGNGIERVVYELNPGLHCLSPLLRAQYVTGPKNLLPALERVAASGDRPQEPMDRHIAAFLIVRERRSESLFDAMTSSPASPRRGLALLNLYSDMQYKHGPDNLPYFAQWLLPLLEPAMQRFLGKNAKQRTREQAKEAAARGNLGALVKILDDPRHIERDQQEFMAARMLYLTTMKEIAMLENRLANREAVVQASGKPMAASISTFIAIVLMFVAILRAAWRVIS